MTNNPESSRNFEPAPPAELESVYNTIVPWLENYGELVIDETMVIRGTSEGGLPIVENGPPALHYVIRGDVLLQFAPAAAEAFEVGESLELIFNYEYYEYFGKEEVEHSDPAFCVNIKKSDTSLLESERLWIHPSETGDDAGESKWTSDRDDSPRENLDIDEAVDLFQSNIAQLVTEHAIGLDKVTRGECQALLEIASRLDQIKAVQDQAPT